MQQFKAFKFRIYSTKELSQLVGLVFGAKRWVYNYFLAENNVRYENLSDVRSDLGVNDIPMALQKITNKTERSLKIGSKLVMGVSNRKDLIFA